MSSKAPVKKGPRALPVPPAIATSGDAREVARAWIASGTLQVSLISAFEKPEMWGLLLANLARHAARVYEADGISSADEALQRITNALQSELRVSGDLGTIEPLRRV